MICEACKYCDYFEVSEVGCFGKKEPCRWYTGEPLNKENKENDDER